VSEHNIVSPKIYITIFAALMVCTFLTVEAAKVDLNHYFPGLNIIVALVIATFKASLVVLFFMHGKYSPKRTQLVIICSVFWLAIMLFMTMSDYISRPWS
jgi:cytochrome c oxidase subunit IV